ncbi:MAG: hypothetical protein Q8M83_04145 [bacterium]|nr:hypothetical protein [bacterium]
MRNNLLLALVVILYLLAGYIAPADAKEFKPCKAKTLAECQKDTHCGVDILGADAKCRDNPLNPISTDGSGQRAAKKKK